MTEINEREREIYINKERVYIRRTPLESYATTQQKTYPPQTNCAKTVNETLSLTDDLGQLLRVKSILHAAVVHNN